MRLTIVLSVDHGGQPRRPTDMGAGADLDGDGRVSLHEREAAFTMLYGLAAYMHLKGMGHRVYLITHTDYKDRHKWANSIGADAYVAMHMNAGGGSYSAVFYDHRTRDHWGKALAENIDQQLGGIAEIGGNRRVWDTDSRPQGQGWRKNAHSTIEGVKRAASIVFEPLFLDTPKPDQKALLTPDGMQRIGLALANGIDAWGKTLEGA
jgi:N-acetylmuramoyl-L-alanine amidase